MWSDEWINKQISEWLQVYNSGDLILSKPLILLE